MKCLRPARSSEDYSWEHLLLTHKEVNLYGCVENILVLLGGEPVLCSCRVFPTRLPPSWHRTLWRPAEDSGLSSAGPQPGGEEGGGGEISISSAGQLP